MLFAKEDKANHFKAVLFANCLQISKIADSTYKITGQYKIQTGHS